MPQRKGLFFFFFSGNEIDGCGPKKREKNVMVKKENIEKKIDEIVQITKQWSHCSMSSLKKKEKKKTNEILLVVVVTVQVYGKKKTYFLIFFLNWFRRDFFQFHTPVMYIYICICMKYYIIVLVEGHHIIFWNEKLYIYSVCSGQTGGGITFSWYPNLQSRYK